MKYLFSGGIYQIRNKLNGNCYIGSSSNLNKRIRVHKISLSIGEHHARYLQRSWNKYGKAEFEFNILLFCDNDNLLLYEQLFLDAYKPKYNTCMIAGNCLGIKHTEETRKKISKARIGNKNALGSRGCVGRVLSEETKRKIGKTKVGNKYCLNKKLSEEHKNKISMSRIGTPAWNKGIKNPIMSETKKLYWRNWRIERGIDPDIILRNLKKSEVKEIKQNIMDAGRACRLASPDDGIINQTPDVGSRRRPGQGYP